MTTITRVGLDLAKNVFEVHGVDEHGKPVLRKTLSRNKVLEYFAQLPPCMVGMEACASSHHWARALGNLGHTVRLMAPQFVRPYRKNEKNDRNDAEAICEAVSRPTMRFVPVKSVDQHAVLTVHRVRARLVSERTALVNQVRGLLAEYGIVVAQGVARLRRALPTILEDAANGLPTLARQVFAERAGRLTELEASIATYDQHLATLVHASPAAQRLCQLGGVGPITATAVVATIGDGKTFRNGRQFAAWLGLTPRQHSSGGKARLGRISKRGDVYLRTLLIHGTRAVLRVSARQSDAKSQWAERLKARRGTNVAAVALAAKHARILWALLARGQDYRMAA